jgi:hypothetical protein
MAEYQVARNKAIQQASYQNMALLARDSNDPWLAFAAQFASDILAIQFALSTEKELAVNDRVEILDDMWLRIEQQFQEDIATVDSGVNVATLLGNLRDIYSNKLTAISWAYFTELVAPSSAFTSSTITPESSSNTFGFDFFGGADSKTNIKEYREKANSLYTEYYMLKDRASAPAFTALYQADLLLFQAWLLDGSQRIQDNKRLWASTKMALATGYLRQLAGIPTDIEIYHKSVRAALINAAGIENAESLQSTLPDILG